MVDYIDSNSDSDMDSYDTNSNPIVKELEANGSVYDIIGKGITDISDNSSLKVWTGTRAQFDAIETKDNKTIYNVTDSINSTQALLERIWPVGSIYMGEMSVCPLSALFGTWTLVSSGRVIQGSDANHSAGTSIEAGLPNITGEVNIFADGSQSSTGSALTKDGSGNTGIAGNSSDLRRVIHLDASRSSSIYGNSDTVQPAAYVVNIWKRTA